MINYRRKYKKEVCEIPKGFDVHHLDENRENNDIDNLLMLPKKLHQKYHKVLIAVQMANNNGVCEQIYPSNHFGSGLNKYIEREIIAFNEVYYECKKWADYKEYLLGNLPNIHNIELYEKI